MYTFPNVFSSEPTPLGVLGAVSVIFWTITLITIVKYILIVMNFNDEGEGMPFQLARLTVHHNYYCQTLQYISQPIAAVSTLHFVCPGHCFAQHFINCMLPGRYVGYSIILHTVRVGLHFDSHSLQLLTVALCIQETRCTWDSGIRHQCTLA